VATSHDDPIWAWRMWDQLKAVNGWTDAQVSAAQAKVVGRGYALIGTAYDWPAYVAFSLEVLHLRNEEQLKTGRPRWPVNGRIPRFFVPSCLAAAVIGPRDRGTGQILCVPRISSAALTCKVAFSLVRS
jgi:hypothetical protein